MSLSKHALTVLRWENATVLLDTRLNKKFSVKGNNFNKKSASLAKWLEFYLFEDGEYSKAYRSKLAKNILTNGLDKLTSITLKFKSELQTKINGLEDTKELNPCLLQEIKKAIESGDFCLEDGVGCSTIAKIAHFSGLKLEELTGKHRGQLIDLGFDVIEA